MSDLETLLERLEVRIASALIAHRTETEWEHYEWRVVLSRGEHSYGTDYRTGKGHVQSRRVNGKPQPTLPKAADVVSCLMSDGQSGLETFEDFCSEFGHDPDSRKALDTYLACQRSLTGMRRLFREHFDAVAAAAGEH